MLIKTSSNEGSEHILLKKKAIEMLKEREDVIEIDTEHKVKKKVKYYKFVDVYALKKDGGNIYVEVKTDNTLSIAVSQLSQLYKKDRKDEFIIVCNFDKLDFFKKIWREKMYEWQNFINEIQIYTFNKEYELKLTDVKYKKGKELWIDGIKII